MYTHRFSGTFANVIVVQVNADPFGEMVEAGSSYDTPTTDPYSGVPFVAPITSPPLLFPPFL